MNIPKDPMHVFEEPTPVGGMADDTQDVLASDTFDIDDARSDAAAAVSPIDEWHHHHHDNPQGSSVCDVRTHTARQ